MIKVSAFLPKRADLTDEQFHAHWRHPHGDLAVRTQRIRRYVQLHSFDPAISADIRNSRNGPEQYDGVAQLWFDSFEDMAVNAGNPEAAAAARLLLEDERKFIDLEKSPLWWGEEKVIF